MTRFDFQTMKEAVPLAVADIPDWDQLCEWIPRLVPLADCMQDEIHHGEKDVATHTCMVVRELVSDPEWLMLDDEARFRLFWAAVMHDIGKPATTDTVDGRIVSPRHSRAGAFITREVFRDIEVPFSLREEICSIITAHQLPFHLYDRPDADRKAIELSLVLRPTELFMHARADARGRICADKADILLRVDLSETIFDTLGILNQPFAFENDESRVAYFMSDDRNPFYGAHEAYLSHITIMSGLPGSGKDTWIKANRPGVPVVSMDSLREELDVSPEGNQGTVIQAAMELARVHLRAKRDFVWNTTNITKDMRGKILQLVHDYHDHCKPRITIAYLEPAPKTLLSQNAARSAAVRPSEIAKLARKLDPPKPWEAHEIVSVTPGLPSWDAPFQNGAGRR